MFTTQYLSPPDQSQQTPLFDVKNSPLALLAQTCNSIGKDIAPFNRTLSTSTPMTFSILPCKGHDPAKNDDHGRCSSEDDVTSTMTPSTIKTREPVRKTCEPPGRRSAVDHDDDDPLDVVGLIGDRGNNININNNSNNYNYNSNCNDEDDLRERASEPIPLTSKHQSKSLPSRSKASKSSGSSSTPSARRASTAHRNLESSLRKNEGRHAKEHRSTDHGKKSGDSWLLNLPFKQNCFAPGADGVYPGYFNFFPQDYSHFLKNYYMSQVTAHTTAPFLNFPYSTYPDQLGKLRSSPQSLHSFSPLQPPPPHSPSSVSLKPHGDLFGSTQGKHLNSSDRNLPPNFLSGPVLSNHILQSSKELQNLSYMHFISHHNSMLLAAHAPLTCPFPFKPIGESCSKLFGSFDDVMDHVKLHWAEGKDSLDSSMFSHLPPFSYPPLSWPLKALDETQQQVLKLSSPPGRFHPYVKPFLSNHVP